jgi:hypothetical protein
MTPKRTYFLGIIEKEVFKVKQDSLEDWSNGVLEYWNTGQNPRRKPQYSITPVQKKNPGLEAPGSRR